MNHLIVHPGWGLGYGDPTQIEARLGRYETAYTDYCQTQIAPKDSVVVFFPFLDNADKMILLEQALNQFAEKTLIPGEVVNPDILQQLLQTIYNRDKQKHPKTKPSLDFNQWFTQQRQHPEPLREQLVALSRQHPLFYGCLLNNSATLAVANLLNEALQPTGAHLAYMNCGILSMAHEKVQELFGRMTGQLNVQIIGDWYNECVYSVVLQLNEIAHQNPHLSIHTKVLSQYCAFNEHKTAYQKHLIHSQNREHFLFVQT